VSSLWQNKDLAGQFSFDNYFIDARHFIDLKKKNVLAFQLIANFNNGDIPYRQLSTIGNENYMRGYYNGRYRDKHMFSFQTELRTLVWGPLGAVLFGGIGNVGNTIPDLTSNMKPNYGIGIRGVLLRKDHINFRIDWGFGEGKNKGLYLTLHEAF
jgi:hemolysin activation/secretion protein